MSSSPAHSFPVVLAAPSGTGKTTVARELVARSDRFVFSVSATTRPRRGEEAEGRDYEFVSRDEFQGMLDRGELVEWAEVHGHLYGTLRSALADARATGRFPVLDIDVQGARQIRTTVPEAILIFLLPPSAVELEARLRGRATERNPDVERRLRAAGPEFEAAAEFDYLVMNGEVEDAVHAVEEIACGEAHRAGRNAELRSLIGTLRRDIETLLEHGRDAVPTRG